MSGSWPFSEMAAWRSLKSSRFSTRSCKRSTVLVSASTFCNTAVSLISFFPDFTSIHLDGVPRQQEEHAKVSNAQPVIIALGLEFANIASQVLPHFFNPPADIAPLFLGQCPQLLARLPADFNPVTHQSFNNTGYPFIRPKPCIRGAARGKQMQPVGASRRMRKTFDSPKAGPGATLSPEVMNEFQVIESALKGAARRRRGERAWRGFWQGLLAGGLIWLLTIAAYKIFPLPAGALLAGGIAAAVVALAGLVLVAGRRISMTETARWVDAKKQLQERLSTALELAAAPGAGEWKDLLVRDAARHAKDLDARQLLPFRLPMVSRWALLVVALGTGLGFVPEYRSREFVQKQKDAANIRDAGKQLAELTRQKLAQRPPVLEPTLKAMEAVAEMGDKLDHSTLTRSEALRDLTSVTDKLAQQTKELEKNPALKPLERAARESTTGGTPSPG